MNLNFDKTLSRIYKLLKIGLLAFFLLKFLSLNVSAAEMKVNCSSSDKSNCVGLFQGNNATSINTNVITNYSTSSSYRYFSITSMPLEISTKYTFKVYYSPSARSINNIYYRWYYTDINDNTQTINGYTSASYTSTWLNGINVSVASFTLTTSDYYRNNTSNFINLDFGSSGVTIRKIEITSTETENTSTILDAIEGIVMGATLENYSCFVNAEVDLVASLEGSYIAGSTGSINKNNNFNVSYKYGVAGNKSYQINFKDYNGLEYGRLCWYKDDTVLSCPQYRTLSDYGTDPLSITSPAEANFLMITYRKGSNATLQGNICINKEYQELDEVRKTNDKLDETNDKLDETNNYLKDDSNPTVDNQGIQNTINSVNQSNPLEYFLTLPTTLINSTITGLNSNSCTAWKIGRFGTIGRHDLSNYEFTFPCINLRQKLGDDLFLIIDTFVAVGILTMTVVNLYHTISNYITLGAEDEVRSHSSFLSPMDFLGNILGGNAGGVISHMKE